MEAEYSLDLKEEATEDSGVKINSTVKAGIKKVQVMRGMGNGLKEKGLNGQMNTMKINKIIVLLKLFELK